MAILTNPGRSGIAQLVKDQNLHLAWGSGNPDWDATPALPDVNASSLIAEIGRRKSSDVRFCIPDPLGSIVVPNGTFSLSDVPTKYLYIRFSFAADDSPEGQIRELAVFWGTVPKVTVPEGQMYLLPADVLDFGNIISIEHVDKIERSPAIRQQFEIIIQF
jgi:hypothetical protein